MQERYISETCCQCSMLKIFLRAQNITENKLIEKMLSQMDLKLLLFIDLTDVDSFYFSFQST